MNTKLVKHIFVLSALVVVLAIIVALTYPLLTGLTALESHDMSIQKVVLEHTTTGESKLIVNANIVNHLESEDIFSVYLLIDDIEKAVRRDQVFLPNTIKIVNLDCPLSLGVHSVKVEVADQSFETIIKVAKDGDEFVVTELAVGTKGVPVEHKLDFSGDRIEYDIFVEEDDVVKLSFKDKSYLLAIDKLNSEYVVLGEKTISLGGDAVFDLDENEKDDIRVIYLSLDDGVASLKVKSLYKSSIWDKLLSFWWLILIVIVLVIAFFLMRKTEILRTKHGRRILKKVEDAREEGVISDSLAKKARRVVKDKLKP